MDPPDFLKEYLKSTQEISEMIRILGQDCKDHFAAIQNSHSQLNKRAYVRSVFALIEGVLYNLKSATSNLGIILKNLTLNELVVLDGTQLDINDDGNVTTKPYYPKFINNFKFSFKIYAKSIGSKYIINLSGQGWQSLCKSVKVRDRLMHPKESSDLAVSDEEILDAKKAIDWFLLNYSLSGYYAQKSFQDKLSTSKEDVSVLESNIHRIEAELSARGN